MNVAMKMYLIVLGDRQRGRMFTFGEGEIVRSLELINDDAPQKVKNGENTWDAQDKIFRHIEDHLHRHLVKVTEAAREFVKKEKIRGVIIGGHKPLFSKIESEMRYPLSKKVLGKFVTELKVPTKEIVARVKEAISEIEALETENMLQQSLR